MNLICLKSNIKQRPTKGKTKRRLSLCREEAIDQEEDTKEAEEITKEIRATTKIDKDMAEQDPIRAITTTTTMAIRSMIRDTRRIRSTITKMKKEKSH